MDACTAKLQLICVLVEKAVPLVRNRSSAKLMNAFLVPNNTAARSRLSSKTVTGLEEAEAKNVPTPYATPLSLS